MGRVLAAIVTVCMLLAPSAAHAHGALKSSAPAKNTKLTAVPKEIALVFNEPVELVFTRVELAGPDGKVSLAGLVFAGSDKRAVKAGIEGPLVAGPYTVTWQMAGADGHPIRGNFAFSVEAGASGLGTVSSAPGGGDSAVQAAAGTAGSGGAPGEGTARVHHDAQTFPDAGGFNAESPLYVVIRWLQFGAILIMTGAVAFHVFVLGLIRKKHGPDVPMLLPASQRAALVGLYAALFLAMVAVVRLLAQSYAMHAPGTGFAPALMWSMIGLTTWGWGWLLQVVATVVAITGFVLARRKRAEGWIIAAVGAVLGSFAPALSGHAAAAPALRPLAIMADGIHIIGASGWLGSLLVLLVAGIPAAMALDKDDRGQAVARLVNAFSPTALVFAGLTASTGVFAAWLHLESISALWQTDYGTMLFRKLVILSIVAGIGAWNFRYVKPRLGELEGVKKIKRSATFEVGVASVVLLITAILVATPPAMDQAGMVIESTTNDALAVP
ncbi:MAG: copper resistance protein CopC [Gemmatimonadaceae bacterium]